MKTAMNSSYICDQVIYALRYAKLLHLNSEKLNYGTRCSNKLPLSLPIFNKALNSCMVLY